MTHSLEIRHLGTIDYQEAADLQRRLVEERRAGSVSDLLLLLEHPHVITLGVRARGDHKHVLATGDELTKKGVALIESGRGGDVTYHGPGQLVVYPILDLKPDRCDVHRYVRDLEEVLIRTAATFGVRASRVKGLTGVWVGDRKLAAIGVRISRWITSHGVALNVTTDLSYFNLIVPCGIVDRRVTSLEQHLGQRLPMADVEAVFTRHFCDVLDRVASGIVQKDYPGLGHEADLERKDEAPPQLTSSEKRFVTAN